MRTFVLYLNPIPKGRPRFNTKTKRVYTPERTKTFQNEVRKLVCLNLGQYFDYPMFEKGVPVCVSLDFVYQRTLDLSKKRYKDILIWREIGDDIDNLVKSVLDALNDVLWADDRQVVEIRARKLWAKKGEEPRICLVVKTAGDPPQATCDFWNADFLDSLAGRKSGE